ncbi:MAG: glycosyltransferase family 4 protein [Lachnospiraceae bacterium]|nr:glycosyltransferase family 4 protein [Lachnospiraceae bacterium]
MPDAFRWQKKQEDDKKDLLIYAHYYYPDVASTGQILTDLAEGLGETFHTTVICTVPSYTGVIDKHYKQHKYYYENIGGVDVLRIRVPEFRKNFSPSRIINILSYFFGAIWATFRVGHQDYIYTISQPPVLGAMLGVLGKWIKHGKLIYNIQDFNPEQVQAVSFTNNRLILGTMMFLDKFACRRADRIVIVGRDMIETLKKRFPKETPGYALINNWIDEKEIVPLPDTDERVLAFREKYGLGGKLVIMYSGNIGLYYDLLEIEKIAASYRDRTDVVFAFVGQGSVLEEMQAYKEREKAENICFIPYQDKMDLVYSLNAGDVHLVANARGIKGVSVPSKLYGVMAVGKPVLGILEEGAEARIIVEEADCGKVVAPGDYDGVRRLIDFFTDEQNRGELAEMGRRGRNFLDANLTREISIRKYADEMLALK